MSEEREKMTIGEYRTLTENPTIFCLDGEWFTKIPVKGYSALKIFCDGLVEENKQLREELDEFTLDVDKELEKLNAVLYLFDEVNWDSDRVDGWMVTEIKRLLGE